VFFSIFRETGDHAALVDAVASDLKISPASILWFQAWAGSPDFPAGEVQRLWQKGVLPHITWEPWDPSLAVAATGQIHLNNIIDGQWDAYIIKWAKAAKQTDAPLLLRWGHEMNGNWYPWAPAMNGNDPQLYIKAYRHVHDLFVAQGATKVLWVWCINVDSVPSETWNQPSALYPGDAYVDWIGLDGWGTGVPWGAGAGLHRPLLWRLRGGAIALPLQARHHRRAGLRASGSSQPLEGVAWTGTQLVAVGTIGAVLVSRRASRAAIRRRRKDG